MDFDENLGFENFDNTDVSNSEEINSRSRSNEDLTAILNEDESIEHEKRQVKWSEFVEVTVMNFFNEHKIERLSVEDGNGNKAKLSRMKDSGIKIEYFSTLII